MSNQNLQKLPEFSVVILCYQAGEYARTFVAEVMENISRLNVDYELVLVANYWEGSQDKTPQIARELQRDNPFIKAVTLPKKGMMGWDMISGLNASGGSVIAVIDGDGQMPAEDLVRVYKKLKEEKLDFVKTYRTKREDGFYRIFISLAYNLIFRILFPGLPVRDANSKPKIFTREVLEKMRLTSFDWFADAEMIIKVRRFRLKIGEIPTIFKKIDIRPSYVRADTIWEFVRNLIKARLNEFGVRRRKG